ncbi:Myosin heavy chain-related isoform 2 [Hibiscus syriacus]|uniref:Myosin heavy chain-related isoform 2 n=1 Tax=Hibiscus syriacus TaxID=106335 RepID=A0A6A2XQC5_HIBSY|nr:Myosin heavy chain-related isoform 2 [Hibiscus syriacus]
MNRVSALQQVPNDEPEKTPQKEDDVPNEEQQREEEEHKGDYLDVRSRPFLMKILRKQGDSQVLFADKVLKFTTSGKMKRRILIITDFAVYLIDPLTGGLKRRIALAAVDKLCLSELHDNFFSVVIPTEYDLLMASTRKAEIATLLYEAIKASAQYELEELLNWCSFEYNATADMIKEVLFEEVEGGVRTRIVTKKA